MMVVASAIQGTVSFYIDRRRSDPKVASATLGNLQREWPNSGAVPP